MWQLRSGCSRVSFICSALEVNMWFTS
jgi:hypothetical protein